MCIAERRIDLSEVDDTSLSGRTTFHHLPSSEAVAHKYLHRFSIMVAATAQFLIKLALLDEYVDIKELFLYRSVLAVLHVLFLSV